MVIRISTTNLTQISCKT